LGLIAVPYSKRLHLKSSGTLETPSLSSGSVRPAAQWRVILSRTRSSSSFSISGSLTHAVAVLHIVLGALVPDMVAGLSDVFKRNLCTTASSRCTKK
jgi:hypothetical protein